MRRIYKSPSVDLGFGKAPGFSHDAFIELLGAYRIFCTAFFTFYLADEIRPGYPSPALKDKLDSAENHPA